MVAPRKYQRLCRGRIKLAPGTKRNNECSAVVSGAIEKCLVNDKMSSLIGINTGRYNLHDLIVIESTMYTISCQCQERITAMMYLNHKHHPQHTALNTASTP